LRSLGVGRHLNEREAARSSGLPIQDHLEVGDVASAFAEDVTELLLRHAIGEVADIKPSSHVFVLLGSDSGQATRDDANQVRSFPVMRSSVGLASLGHLHVRTRIS
jgi:hypothetical protein